MRWHRRSARGISIPGLLSLSLFGAAWGTPAPTRAAGASTPVERSGPHTASVSPLVELRVVGSEESFRSLRHSLGEQRLGRAELQWSLVERFAPQQILSLFSRDKVIVHCWIILTDPEQAHLYFVAPKHDRFMMRDFDLEHRFGTLELASLAQIVETSVDVLLTDAEAGMSRSEVEVALGHAVSPPEPAVVIPPEARQPPQTVRQNVRYGWLADGGYAFKQYSRELALLHGPTITLGLEREHRDTRQWLQLSVGYAFPSRVSGKTVSAEVSRALLALSTSFLWTLPRTPTQSIGPRATVGLGYVGATSITGSLPGVYDLESPRASLEPYLGLGTDFLLALGIHGALIARLDVEAVLRPVRHAIGVSGNREILTEGRRFRLGAGLGILLH